MAEVRFNLKSKTKNEETLILLIFRHNGKRMVVSTQKKINPKYWNDKGQTVRKSYPNDSAIFNSFLKDIRSKANAVITKFVIEEREFTAKDFKKEFEIAIGRAEKKKEMTFFQFIEKFIKDREQTSPESSIKVYQKIFNHLQDFSQATREYKKISFNDIDLDFLKKFTAYLYSPAKMLSKNYVQKIIQNIKLFMNTALEEELHSNIKYKSRKFSIAKEEIEKVYLTEAEIKQIYDTPLRLKRLERVRDYFVLDCYLGLRFSDLDKIRKENIEDIKGKKILSVNTQKTKTTVKIPLRKEALEILEKYNYQLPRPITNQQYNKALKEIGIAAKLNNTKTISRTKGGIYVSETKSKAELLTSHVARRTFTTNLYIAKIPAKQIMDLTGHKSMAHFLEYVSYNKEENAINLAENEYFK